MITMQKGVEVLRCSIQGIATDKLQMPDVDKN